eukprot:1157733-Pelagomonas_calceolata.AAC.7
MGTRQWLCLGLPKQAMGRAELWFQQGSGYSRTAGRNVSKGTIVQRAKVLRLGLLWSARGCKKIQFRAMQVAQACSKSSR